MVWEGGWRPVVGGDTGCGFTLYSEFHKTTWSFLTLLRFTHSAQFKSVNSPQGIELNKLLAVSHNVYMLSS